MTTKRGDFTLRTGERVTASVVLAPDPARAPQLEAMLRHKGDPWNWQNARLLREPTGLATRFYVLERRGEPFANIMLAEHGGVALLGHVWTNPDDRGAGASALLMGLLLEDFAARDGRVIFLGTGFGSLPWHYYRRRGFEPIEPGSGAMARYFEAPADFEREWFAGTRVELGAIDWTHWVTAIPLFLHPAGGSVRLWAAGLFGRALPEEALLRFLRDAVPEIGPADRRAYVATLPDSGAAVGWASATAVPWFPGARIVDVFCHPDHWDCAPELLERLALPARHNLAACDPGQIEKQRALAAHGFKPVVTLSGWLEPVLPRPADPSLVLLATD